MTNLSNINLTGPVALAIGWRDRNTIDGGRIEISNDVANHFRYIAISHLGTLDRCSPRAYSPEADLEPHEEYMVFDLAELDPDEQITNLLDRIELRDNITTSDLPKKSLLFYCFVFPHQAIFLRKMNPNQSAKKGAVLTRLANTLSRIVDPVFSFDRRVDMVFSAEELLITNRKAFELLFKGERYFIRHIGDWVQEITDHIPLTPGSGQLIVDRCRTNTRLRRRLETIHRRGHLKDVTITEVRRQAEKHSLDHETFIHNGELDFHDVSIDVVLKLLNEDLLIGDFSGVPFAVERKIPR
ncbi:MAG: DUF4868 domain-containing protein [bacterium]|nr:DUF4868 domain-containing protein [bacterium]